MTDKIEKKSKQKKPRLKINRGDPQKAMNFFNQAMTTGQPSTNPTGGMAEAVDTEVSKKIERNLPKVKRDKNESLELNEMAFSRQDAIDRCVGLGKKFVEHFDKIYNSKDKELIDHWAKEMDSWWNQVKDIKMKPSGRRIYNVDLMDWFFDAGQLATDFMTSDDTFEERDVYEAFEYKLLNRETSVVDLVNEMFPLTESVQLNEVGLSRIIDHIKDKKSFAIIGSQDKDTKESRYNELLQLVRKIPYRVGWNNLEGTYTYDSGEVGSEDSLIIYNIKKEDALNIAKKINQESIIWKDENFFGFLTAEGEEDGNFGGNLSFDKDAVKAFGSKLKGKHNNAKGFVFESSLVETTNRGSNFSRQSKAEVVKYPILKINEAEKMTKERNFNSFWIDIPYKDLEVEFYGGFDYDSGPWSDYKYMDTDYTLDWDTFFEEVYYLYGEDDLGGLVEIAHKCGWEDVDMDNDEAIDEFLDSDAFREYVYDHADEILDANLKRFQDSFEEDAQEAAAQMIADSRYDI